ncbi:MULTISPECIES: polysaccharide deacetylase family protein [Streptomyces]|uniref:Poly-beta-1,6-N-acetyl-D-glucosamine N-deacetylase n=1 Tax=Streptomyces chartreusis NRRL 3882 TaxID=1079985 RepID=A0A2N9B2J4_STRCX|nr:MULTISPECIES: polysaccharide deacetylase family protein [Streptomyces]MYS93090.1 polysaccharide deacetylase family protein [Streptomyces sp. SID5464]SOR77552.1 Poly-beta-1,6-N-acetyl-D-glucosamine N-deacetylase precursor [Streptomyces chartreusis NRRL 3882]
MNDSVPILMYHAIAHTPASSTRALSVSPDTFAAQMRLLDDNGFTPLTTARLAAAWRGGPPLPARPVLITFDDGYQGVHRHALPVLRELGFPATLFVATGWLRGPQEIAGAALDTMLDWDEVRELAAAGAEIGAHSHSHPQLDQLPDDALRYELEHCKEIITEQLGSPPASFAYPYGYSDRRVRRMVRTVGFTQAVAVRNALAGPRQAPFSLRRVTVRRSTGPEEFTRLVEGRAVARTFALDRTLTTGYAMVRGSRRLLRKAAWARARHVQGA